MLRRGLCLSLPEPSLVKICGLSTPETLRSRARCRRRHDRPRLPSEEPALRHRREGGGAGRASRAAATEIVALIVDFDAAQAARAGGRRSSRTGCSCTAGRHRTRSRAIQAATGRRVMKALGVGSGADLAAIPAYRGVADRILLDAKPPKDAAYPGGHGKRLRLELSGRARPRFALHAIGRARSGECRPRPSLSRRPAGVDVSSGVERAPGVKEVDRIGDFVAAAARRRGFAVNSRRKLKKAGQT